MGLLRDIVDRYMGQYVRYGLQQVAKKQPYGTDDRWTGINRALWDWMSKTIHAFQVLPDAESAFKIVDMANEIGLLFCNCRDKITPEQPEVWKCIALNNSAKITFQLEVDPIRVISKDEAKEIIAAQRTLGCFQSVGWQWDANVSWMCNCDQFCGAHRTPECPWTMIPSFFVSHLVKPEACDGCQVCLEWCLRPGAIRFNKDGRVITDELHAALCRGCGQCIEHCPTGALGFLPRQVYWDVPTKSVKRLPPAALPV
jgi:Pyruvate/2-oxoacid:ferredoxin oxidoreductase delta subunit